MVTDRVSKKNIWKHSLATRQLTYILLFSSFITLFSASLQLYLEYKKDIGFVKSQIRQIEYGHLKSLTNSLWKLDDDQIRVELNDALSLRDIIYLEIKEKESILFSSGESKKSRSNIIRRFQMIHRDRDVDTNIGQLTVIASLDGTYERLVNRVFYILVTQTIKTFLVSFFILFIIHRLITRHLVSIADQIKKFDLKTPHQGIFLKRKKNIQKPGDELDFLVSSFNEMQQQLSLELEKQEQHLRLIRDSEKKYRLLVDTAPYGIQLTDKNGKIVFSNPAHHKLHGYKNGELVGKYVWQLAARKNDRDYIKHYYQTLIKDQPPPEPFFSRDKTRDGRLIDSQINWDYIKNSSNEVTGIISIISDITSRKQTEDALKTAHKRFLTVLDSIDATIYVADMETHEILFMNKNMVESYGRNLTGEICWKAFRDEKGPCSFCPNDTLVNKDGTPGDVHMWQTKNPVTQKWYINYDRAIEWTDGRIVKLQIATDITEFKIMEDELRQAHKMESIGILAGGIAHDFNNILSIILGNTELALIDTPEWSPANGSLKEIKTASIRAKEVVRQLLNFSRKTEKNQTPQNLAQLVKESAKLLRSSIPSNIEIIEKVPEVCHTVLADATQIHQVIINLCTNAAHAMSGNSGILEIQLNNVTVKSKKEIPYATLDPGEYLELIVKDTGSGIDPDITEKIFDPYFTTKEVGKGTGMGLAVVHGIIKNHNGSVYVDSRPGKGSSFHIFFPAVAGHELKNTAPQTEPPQSGSEKILFIDDEIPIVDMTKKILTRLGYTVIGQTNPIKAIEEFEKNPDDFDLVISDMTMPAMNGIELSGRIKKINPDIPIIICTGDRTILDEKKEKALEVSAFVLKPVSITKIAKVIQDVLNS